MQPAMLLGIDVGGTNMRVGVVSGLRVIDTQRVHTNFAGLCRSLPPDRALQAIHQTLLGAITAAMARHPSISAIGIGFPGFVMPRTGLVSQSPNLPGLRDIDLAGPLSQTLSLPVRVENDALAAAYGEFMLMGGGRGGLIYLGLGTGVGGGLIYDGAPVAGEHGVAMEVGHLIVEPGGRPCGCGNAGCMEQYASASGVAISYCQATGQHATAHEIAQRGAVGDPDAIAAYALAGEKLAQALAHVLKVADVAHVVIGGGMSAGWPLLAPAFHRRLESDLIPVLRDKVHIALSQSGDQAGMLGAALLALQS